MANVIPFGRKKEPDWILMIRSEIADIHKMQAVLNRQLLAAKAQNRRGDMSRIRKDQSDLQGHLKFRRTMLENYERGL